jgi:hypothetical protein
MDKPQMSGAELEQALRDDTLGRQVQGVTVTVLIKASGTKGQVSVTASGCEEWIDVPSSMIDEAQVIGTRPCADHSHPLARLTLTPPKSEEGQALSRLLGQLTRTEQLQGPPPWLGSGMGAAARPIGPGGGLGSGWTLPPISCYLGCLWEYLHCINGPNPWMCEGLLRLCGWTCRLEPPVIA